MAEFAYNNTISATTGITPFFALYGQHPRWIIKQNPATKTPFKRLQQGQQLLLNFFKGAVTEVNMVQKLLKIVELCSSLLPLPCKALTASHLLLSFRISNNINTNTSKPFLN